MPLVIPTGYGQAAIEMRNDGDPDPWYITLGVDLTAAGGAFEDAALNVYNAWCNTIGTQLSTATSSTGVNLYVGQDGPERLQVRVNGSFPGSTAGAMLPQNCAALYDKVTARPGRRGKGRFFVPSILKEGGVNAVGVIDNGDRGDLQLQATAFLTELAEGAVPDLLPATPMVVLHNSGIGDTSPTPVTALSVQGVISTQRRRLR